MSKSNETPSSVVEITNLEATQESPQETPSVGRIRSAARRVGTYVKEHKTATFAVVGLTALVAGSAYAGRVTAPTEESPQETTEPLFNTEIDWDEAPQGNDETVA